MSRVEAVGSWTLGVGSWELTVRFLEGLHRNTHAASRLDVDSPADADRVARGVP